MYINVLVYIDVVAVVAAAVVVVVVVVDVVLVLNTQDSNVNNCSMKWKLGETHRRRLLTNSYACSILIFCVAMM